MAAYHPIGEIWCATLVEISTKVGRELAVQLVIDAMKLSAVNPCFLVMRDHLLSAVDDMRVAGRLEGAQHADTKGKMWRAFARFGMGPAARSDGGGVTGIVADFSPPEVP